MLFDRGSNSCTSVWTQAIQGGMVVGLGLDFTGIVSSG